MTNIDIFKNWNYLYVASLAVFAMLAIWTVVQVLDVYAPSGRRWAVVAGEMFTLSGFHNFDNGEIEKVDVTCLAQGMPEETTQAVMLKCTPLNVYGHTPAA